jgi:murein tripeptide amidase MpaA
VVLRATPESPRQLLALTSLAESVWSHRVGVGLPVDVQLSRDRLGAVAEAGIPFSILIDDLQLEVEQERARIQAVHALREADFFDTYRTFDELDAFIDQLHALHPDVTSTFFVGFSVEGRPIRGIRMTGPGDASARPGVLIDGAQHAREWISPMTVAYIADRILTRRTTDPRVAALLDSIELFVVPVVNPDGYEFSWASQRLWRKNRADNGDGTFGVDLNRNWPVAWGGTGASSSTGDETYCGTGPLSEPEAANLAQFMSALEGKIVGHIDFHSYSQLVLWPYSYAGITPPEPDRTPLISASNQMRAAIGGSSGVGYQAMRSADLYPSGGDIIDWSYREKHNKAFTIELRDTGNSGFILPASEIRPVGEESLGALLTLGEYLATPVRFSLPEPLPAVMAPDSGAIVRVSLTADTTTIVPGSAVIRTRPTGASGFTTAPLTLQSGSIYTGTIPAVGCGSSVEYYFEATTSSGATCRYPLGAPEKVLRLDALSERTIVDDPCETPGAWIVGLPTDTATVGKWANAAPLPTAAQPGSDHSPAGVNCWITDPRGGSSAATYDLDNGNTTLITPRIDASGSPDDFIVRDAMISYWVWFSNSYLNRNDDVFPIWLSNDDGLSWKVCDSLATTTPAWTQRRVRVEPLMSRGAAMRVKFVGQDHSPNSTVECGIDDFRVDLLGCIRSPADMDADGDVDLEDMFAFLNCFDAGMPCADINADLSVDLADFFLFFDAFDHAG